jgi:hypothetical protein
VVGLLFVGRTTTKVRTYLESQILLSGANRLHSPVVWANCSIIFTAHPTEPWVTARLFPSSKQFVLPSPDPVFSSPSAYDPPSIITVSPSDDWLFAYFPGHNVDGTGCLWRRGVRVDNWTIKDYWGFGRGAGVITAAWVGTEREVNMYLSKYYLNCIDSFAVDNRRQRSYNAFAASWSCDPNVQPHSSSGD